MAGGSQKTDAATDSEMESKEAMSLKRGREASLEPSLPETPSTATTSTKKNRLESNSSNRTSPIPETEPDEPDVDVDNEPSPPAPAKEGETGNVGEVRRKVSQMSYKEGKEGDTDVEGDAGVAEHEQEEETGSSAGTKRKAFLRSESSFAAGDAIDAKRAKETPSPTRDTSSVPAPEPASIPEPSVPQPTAASSSAPPKKPQATFGAFSSSSSPFANSTCSTSAFSSGSTSADASGSTSKSVFGASGSKPFSGFGGFSGSASPFAYKGVSAFGSSSGSSSGLKKPEMKEKEEEVRDREGEEDQGEGSMEKQKQDKGSSSFGDILSGSGAVDAEETSDKVQMTEKDVVTGEEEESTLYQTRTKLYVMQSDNSWRERGVGVLRLNVRNKDGQGARLVMRAEGVLRLILNVSLYVGQTCLEDGKHVRTTVFEDGERKFVTFRTGSVKAAQELAGQITEHIPLDSKSPLPV